MKSIIVAVLIIFPKCLVEAQDNWKLAIHKNGIKIYVGHVTDSDYLAFKAIMSLRTTESKIIEILRDVNEYPEWFAFTASTKLISQSPTDQKFFMETDYPWPYINECMRYTMDFEGIAGSRQMISIMGTSDRTFCEKSLKKADGYILLEPDQDHIIITYYFHSEPSQNIPTWLINPMIHKMPYQTFSALKKKLTD